MCPVHGLGWEASSKYGERCWDGLKKEKEPPVQQKSSCRKLPKMYILLKIPERLDAGENPGRWDKSAELRMGEYDQGIHSAQRTK